MIDCANCDGYAADLSAALNRAVRAEARLREVEAERDKALNQARHWQEQEAKQRRLHREQGDWKHRALAAELAAADGRDAEAKLAAVREVKVRWASAPSHAAVWDMWQDLNAALTPR